MLFPKLHCRVFICSTSQGGNQAAQVVFTGETNVCPSSLLSKRKIQVEMCSFIEIWTAWIFQCWNWIWMWKIKQPILCCLGTVHLMDWSCAFEHWSGFETFQVFFATHKTTSKIKQIDGSWNETKLYHMDFLLLFFFFFF